MRFLAYVPLVSFAGVGLYWFGRMVRRETSRS